MMGVGAFLNTIDPHFSEAPQVTMWQSRASNQRHFCNQGVYVPPGEKHQFRNTGSESLTFICVVPNG